MSRVPLDKHAFRVKTLAGHPVLEVFEDARLYVYVRGTTDQATGYTTESGSTVVSQPLLANGSGQFLDAWFAADGEYDLYSPDDISYPSQPWLPAAPGPQGVPGLDGGLMTNAMNPEYEVTGDGVTDDTSGFENVRIGAGEGGHSYVPPNSYILNDVALNAASQKWQFAPGAMAKLKDSATGNQTTLLITGEYVTVDGGEFNGNKSNNSGAGVGVIRVGADHVALRGVRVHDGQAQGIIVNPDSAFVDGFLADGCIFTDCVGMGVFANLTGASAQSQAVTIVNCHSDQSGLSPGTATGGGFGIKGAASYKAKGALIASCSVKSPDSYAQPIAGILATYCDGAQIVGNHVEGAWEAFASDNSDNVAFVGNTATAPTNYGLEIA